MKISDKSQRIVAEVLTRFMFARTMDEVTEVWNQVFEQYGLRDNPFTLTPCSLGEYQKDILEYEKQAMIEKYGHCDGLEYEED